MTLTGFQTTLVPLLKKQTKVDDQIHVNCGVCGSDQCETVHHFPKEYFDPTWYDTYSWDGNLGLELRIVKCKDCGLIYQNPRFTKEALHKLYPNTYIPSKANYAKLMIEHKFDYTLSWLERHLGDNLRGKSILDVGTRYGVLPALLQRKQADAFGIEMNFKCVQSASAGGFEEVYQGTVDDLKDVMDYRGTQKLDAVVMIDLIEHLLDPMKDLQAIAKNQEKGGKLFISTMDASSAGYQVFGKDWYYIHGQHTFYFTPESIGNLLEQAGYRIVSVDRIAKWKSLRQMPHQLKKWATYQWKMRWGVKDKEWFAQHRPHLLDTMNIVAERI